MKVSLRRCIGFIGVFLLSAGCFALDMKCDLCSKSIKGSYQIYSRGKIETIVCEQCNHKWTKCSLCSMPVYGVQTASQEILCEICRQEAKFCAICSRLIREQYYSIEDKVFLCLECNRSAPTCQGCKCVLIPGDWRDVEGINLCKRCDVQIPKCTACAKPILRTSVTFKGFSGVFCSTCVSSLPICMSCGRPVFSGGRILENGASICGECAQTAILTESDLMQLAEKVRIHLESYLLMPVLHSIQLKLVDDLEESKDLSSKESGRFITINDRFFIHIRKGLSRPLCIETLAHEYAHAWQQENVPGLKSEKWREGFAQWVAAQVLTDLNYSALLERFSERDDVYGRGYLDMCEIERRSGVEGLFKTIRKRGRE